MLQTSHMKSNYFQLALISGLLILTSCNTKKESQTEVEETYTEEQIDSINNVAAAILEKDGNHIMGPFYLGMTSDELTFEYNKIQRENDGIVKFLFEPFEISDDDCRSTLEEKVYRFGLISKNSYDAEYYSKGNDNPLRPKLYKDVLKHFSEKYSTPVGLLDHWKSKHKSISVQLIEDESKKTSDKLHFWSKIKIIVYDYHVADSISQKYMEQQWLKNMNQHEASEGL